MKKFVIASAVVLIFYFSFGFFVIQPIGAVPKGATIFYFRLGMNTSFISSADGIILDSDQEVSLLSRLMVMGAFAESAKNRKIITLPYSKSLYLISTGGVEFKK
jgi:hypothetical protein